MKVLTEGDLRRIHLKEHRKEWVLSKDIFITPAAREYAKEQGIHLNVKAKSNQERTQVPIVKKENGTFKDAVTGAIYAEKPEEMTHMQDNLLVSKTHPRIALRGRLDSLQAKILLIQFEFKRNQRLMEDLESVLLFVQKVLAAEVKNQPAEELMLLGMREEEIHRMSHNVQEAFGINHTIPRLDMGRLALLLNELRTQVREAELQAVAAFQEGDVLGVVKRLNRLSSGVYVLFCRSITGYYQGEEGCGT